MLLLGRALKTVFILYSMDSTRCLKNSIDRDFLLIWLHHAIPTVHCYCLFASRLICCVSYDAFLLTMIVQSGYLSYCILFVSLDQSGHSSLTSVINKSFPSIEVPFTGCSFLNCTIHHQQSCYFFYHSGGWCKHHAKLLAHTSIISRIIHLILHATWLAN